MLHTSETTRTLPFYRPLPLTPLPLIYHREHLFPYTSYGDTDPNPVPRSFRLVVLENDSLRVEVAPELGGRVYSLFDKRIGQEILFRNPVVKPVRVLPIWGFISGGIEFNFPIAHSPTSLAEVGCRHARHNDYAFVQIGEREARTGMEWVVELGLWEDLPVLVQRSAFRNPTAIAHPWMSWTIAALRSTADTEFIHPPHRVLVHHSRVEEHPWPGPDLNWDRSHQEMTALFWQPGSAPAFGAFHHELGFGLMHVANPAALPGKKVWTYGHGPHRAWGQATTIDNLSYLEIESGPLLDQSEKPLFPPGTTRTFEECWVPTRSRAECHITTLPTRPLPSRPIPWLGWSHSPWQTAWEQFRAGEAPLPDLPVATGLDLEPSLRQSLGRGQTAAAEPLALWLAFHHRPLEALAALASAPSPTARRLAGLIRWHALDQPAEAVPDLAAGPLHDPIATVELDELYASLHRTAERQRLLARAPAHRRITERRADLALALGQPSETLRLLEHETWPREHQRYVRTHLWRQAQAALGHPASSPPDRLGEDSLAPFGAYWSD